MNQRKRELFLLQVYPGRFSDHTLSAKIVEQIVADLKRDADVLAEIPEFRAALSILSCARCTDFGTRREERSGFVADNLQICLLIEVELPALLNLQQLTLAHPFYGVRCALQEVVVALLQCQEKSPREEIVAHEHGDLVLPDSIDRCETPPRVGIVDNVIMNESRGMQDLNERGGAERTFRNGPARLRAEEHQDRPDAFSLLADNVPGHQIDETDLGTHGIPEKSAEDLQLVLNGLLDVVQRRRLLAGKTYHCSSSDWGMSPSLSADSACSAFSFSRSLFF